LGGIRIILRLTDPEVILLNKRQKESGLTRSELIRKAIDTYWGKQGLK